MTDWKGPGYRLPTEAEWEYACRAGTRTRYSFGDDPVGLGEHAWYGDNSGDSTHPVGDKRDNAFGVFDMHGNVWEWCWDWFGDYEARPLMDDPTGPLDGSGRVIRGGSWSDAAGLCRAAFAAGTRRPARATPWACGWPEFRPPGESSSVRGARSDAGLALARLAARRSRGAEPSRTGPGPAR